jgi:hypothetical protein
VIAAEPIADDNDTLLKRLRAAQHGAPLMPTKRVEDYFQTATGIAVVEVKACHGDLRRPAIRALYKAGDSQTLDVLEGISWGIDVWALRNGQSCAAGLALVITEPFGVVKAGPVGEAASTDPSVFLGLPRIVWIRDGKIRRDDLMTELHLDGPETFTVGQAFGWFLKGGRRHQERWGTVVLTPRSPTMIALLLDLANILGGALLAIGLLSRLPRVGDDLGRAADRWAAFSWVVGAVALIAGSYYLIVHLTSGPHVFHFEVVAIITGVLLLWDRLNLRARTGKDLPKSSSSGPGLLLAIWGVIAIIVGVQGLFTSN